MQSRNPFLVIFAVLFAFILSACVPPSPDSILNTPVPDLQRQVDLSETSAEATRAELACIDKELLCVGLVTAVGSVHDSSFNQAAWEGVKRAEADLLAQVDYIETEKFSDIVENIKYFGEQDYDLIVTVGSRMNTATFFAARLFPHTHFVGIDQSGFEEFGNATGLIFPERKTGFLAGALAAGISQTGIIGIVSPSDLSASVVEIREGFEAGVHSISPKAIVMASYHPGEELGSFIDPEWGAQAARQMLDAGADVVFSGGGTTGNGALAEVANDRRALCIGIGTDQWEKLPVAQPCLISSATNGVAYSVFEIIARVSLDQSGHHNHPSGKYVGKIELAPFHDFDGFIAADLQSALMEITKKLNNDLIPLDGSYIYSNYVHSVEDE